jgi:hypothetical protein
MVTLLLPMSMFMLRCRCLPVAKVNMHWHPVAGLGLPVKACIVVAVVLLLTANSVLASSACAGASQVATGSGSDHVCAALLDGTVRCWGCNAYGQLGDGTKTSRISPVALSGLGSVRTLEGIATGERHACAALKDGSVKCWGSNVYGQLGDGTTTEKTTPTSVSGLSNVQSISTALFFRTVLQGAGEERLRSAG